MYWIILTSSFIVFGQYVGQATCASMSIQATCTNSGYCLWSGSACVNLDCYRVNEVAACRQIATPSFTGALYPACKTLEQFSLQYDNVCVDTADSVIKYAYIRMARDLTGSPTATTTGIAIATISATAVASLDSNLFQLYTLNPWLATNAQLNAILQAYINFGTGVTTNGLYGSQSHPYYMEKLLYQTFQLVRDDTAMTLTLKTTTLGLAYQLLDIYYKRLNSFASYYATNYYFINFAQSGLARLALTVNGQLHTQTLSWLGNAYANNGFIQVVSLPLEQFGVMGSYADAIMVRSVDTAFVGQVVPFKLIWVWTDPSITAAVTSAAQLKLYQFDRTLPGTAAITATAITFTCDFANLNCQSTLITPPNANWNTYFIGSTSVSTTGACVSTPVRNKVQCLLAKNSLNSACSYGSSCT